MVIYDYLDENMIKNIREQNYGLQDFNGKERTTCWFIKMEQYRGMN